MPSHPGLAPALRPGLVGRARLDVAESDTASALGSGDVPVLATPRVVALCEQASLAALGTTLAPGQTSVGMRVQIDHLAPTRVGGVVTADATLEKVEGRRLTFTVAVNDRCGLVAAGRVTRVVVERERFLGEGCGLITAPTGIDVVGLDADDTRPPTPPTTLTDSTEADR